MKENKFKIIFFDSGGVLIFGNPWIKLAKAVGLPLELDQRWLDEFYSGKITYQEWKSNVESYYKKAKLNKKQFEEVLDFKNYTFNDEARPLLNYLKKSGIIPVIISTDNDFFISKVAKHYGIKIFKANNSFKFDRNGLFVRMEQVSSDPEAKIIQIKEVCRELGEDPKNTLFIGDSINDKEAFRLTGHGILYHSQSNKKVRHWDDKLNHLAWKKISSLLEVIGIMKNHEK